VTALSNIDTYFCIDAIPESTFVCQYYLSEKAANVRVSSRSTIKKISS